MRAFRGHVPALGRLGFAAVLALGGTSARAHEILVASIVLDARARALRLAPAVLRCEDA